MQHDPAPSSHAQHKEAASALANSWSPSSAGNAERLESFGIYTVICGPHWCSRAIGSRVLKGVLKRGLGGFTKDTARKGPHRCSHGISDSRLGAGRRLCPGDQLGFLLTGLLPPVRAFEGGESKKDDSVINICLHASFRLHVHFMVAV